MNSVDIVLALVIGYAAYRGYNKGLIGTLASLVAPVAGVVAASRWGADGQELIAQYLQAPTFLLKILAWPMVFLATVAAIRLAAGLATMALGIGNSLPSRVVAAVASASAVGVACGLAIVLLQSFVPPDEAREQGEAREQIGSAGRRYSKRARSWRFGEDGRAYRPVPAWSANGRRGQSFPVYGFRARDSGRRPCNAPTMIAEDQIAAIRDASRISDFISAHVTLKRSGRALKGLCPFHTEKTPSFSVNDDNGFFHCFGCGVSGDVFKFLMVAESLTFPEAVGRVAERYGISLPESDGRPAGERDRLFAVTASAARYFRSCMLKTPAGEPVLEYLAQRGVGDEASEQFALGTAPPSGDGLVRWLRREKIDLADADRLGLIGQRGGRTYDRFRSRLMFPIRDAQGRTVGFGGRTIGENEGPKYLNSPESSVYSKGRVLYGLHEARQAERARPADERSDRLILVEGYMDVIALWEAGVAGAVATCGTALTPDQARLMRRHGSSVVCLFDGDRAGRNAAVRSFPIFVEAGIWARCAFLEEGQDPDSIVRRDGAKAVERLLTNAEPLAEPYVSSMAADGEGAADKAKVGAELAKVLSKVGDPFEYDFFVKKAASWTGISEAVLRRSAGAGPRAVEAPRVRQPRAGAPGPEELLLTLMISHTDVIASLANSAILDAMNEGIWKELAGEMVDSAAAGRAIDSGALLEKLPEDLHARIASRLIDPDLFADEGKRIRAVEDCCAKIKEGSRRRGNAALIDELRRREATGEVLAPERELGDWRQPGDRKDRGEVDG